MHSANEHAQKKKFFFSLPEGGRVETGNVKPEDFSSYHEANFEA